MDALGDVIVGGEDDRLRLAESSTNLVERLELVPKVCRDLTAATSRKNQDAGKMMIRTKSGIWENPGQI